jgi:type I restriction enzyme M protein
LLEPNKEGVLEEERFQQEDAAMADLDPHGLRDASGYVFEELIRKFNEEAGEHSTPREVIKLMSNLVFIPVKDQLPNPLTIYDPACGSGGMLTESQDFLIDPEGEIKAKVGVFLYGNEVIDHRFQVNLSDYTGERFDFYPAIPRSSDGQLLFLMEMVGKMKRRTASPMGSRIASVHNGSALFTGDAGGGESNFSELRDTENVPLSAETDGLLKALVAFVGPGA